MLVTGVVSMVVAPLIAAGATALGAYMGQVFDRDERSRRRDALDSVAKALSRPDSTRQENVPEEYAESRPTGWSPASLERTSGLPAGGATSGGTEIDAAQREIDIYLRYQQGSLNQSNSSFWVSFVVGIIGFAIILLGAGLLLFGVVQEGALTAISGVLPAAAGSLLYARADVAAKRADEKFEKLASNVRQAGAVDRAIHLVEKIEDASMRDRSVAVLALRQLFPDASPESLAQIADSRNSNPSLGD